MKKKRAKDPPKATKPPLPILPIRRKEKKVVPVSMVLFLYR